MIRSGARFCIRDDPSPPYPVQALRRQVGFVFDTLVMFPGTVRDNLQMALALGGDHGHDADTRIAAVMALAELDRALGDREGDPAIWWGSNSA